MLDRRSLVQAPSAPRDQSQHPRARNDYDEETAYESYMNPFQSGPGDSVDADLMAPCLLVTKSSPPSGGLRKSVTFRTSLTGLNVYLISGHHSC